MGYRMEDLIRGSMRGGLIFGYVPANGGHKTPSAYEAALRAAMARTLSAGLVAETCLSSDLEALDRARTSMGITLCGLFPEASTGGTMQQRSIGFPALSPAAPMVRLRGSVIGRSQWGGMQVRRGAGPAVRQGIRTLACVRRSAGSPVRVLADTPAGLGSIRRSGALQSGRNPYGCCSRVQLG